MPTPYQAVVFDFDGTLAELTLDFDEMRHRLAELAAGHLGVRPDPAGRPVLEWIEELAAGLAGDGDAGRAAAARLRSEAMELVVGMEVQAAAAGRLFGFTPGLLAGLARAGVRVGIITRNCGQAVRAVFPGVDAACHCLLAREDVAQVKPHPAHLQRALECLSVAPERALMVGDHPLDMETGRRAGTRTAAVASGRLDLETLLQSSPDHAHPDCRALVEHLVSTGRLPAWPDRPSA
jgi:phosphoglycolate phosphatase